MITQEELKTLETIFTLARQQVVGNEQQLIAVINFKQTLFKKLNQLYEKSNNNPEEKV